MKHSSSLVPLFAAAFAALVLASSLAGCGGTVRGAARATISLKECPSLPGRLLREEVDWRSSLGIQSDDAATLKAGLSASERIGQRAQQVERELRAACLALGDSLGAPRTEDVAASGDAACERASRAFAEEKSRLGPDTRVASELTMVCAASCTAPCDPAAPQGECAQSRASVTVTGATDPEAAARLQSSLQSFAGSLLALHDSQQHARSLIGDAKTAVELGIVTGRAVSYGDVASAASAAACLLPPLLEAKQHLALLRRDLRLVHELARAAGIRLTRPEEDEPPQAAAAQARIAPALMPAPTDAHVQQLFAFPDGGLAAQTRTGVIALPSGEVLLRTMPRGKTEWSLGIGVAAPLAWSCAVGRGRRVACLRSQPVFSGNTLAGTELVLADNQGATGAVARVGPQGSLTPNGIAFTDAGELLYSYTLFERNGQQSIQVARVVRNGAVRDLPFIPDAGALEDLGGGGRANPPITFYEFAGSVRLLFRSDQALLTAPLDRPGQSTAIAPLSAYDARAVAGGDGRLYVFYYEPKSRTARFASSADGEHFTGGVVDGRESGWQLDALPTRDGALVVYYYFRSSSDKGLRSAALQGGKLARTKVIVLREERWNAGWHPFIAQDRTSGRVTLTYLSNVEDNERVWAPFADAGAVTRGPRVPDEDDDEAKNWFVQAGAGVWYTWWALRSPEPDAGEVDGGGFGAGTYAIEPALLLSANVEARWGPIDVGLTYAQNYLDDASKRLGEPTRLLTGNLKIEDLLPGHDIRAEGVWGRYHGTGSRDTKDPVTSDVTTEQLRLETSYIDVQLLALNQWRIKYGLGYSTYRVPAPIFGYYAAANQTRYEFGGSELRDTRFHNIDLVVGYSKLDYAAKYENRFFGPIFDISVAGGLSLGSFDALQTPAGEVTSGIGFNVRGTALLGWLWMHRFASLSGLGFYLRPSYAIEGGVLGTGLSRPDDRAADDAGSADTEAKFMLFSLRHGPWFDAGVVW